MCHISDIEEIEMRQENRQDSDVVAETASNKARTEFHNWLHGDEPKEEMMTAIRTIQQHNNVPGIVRYLMQYSFMAGYNKRESELYNLKRGVE